MRHDGDDDYGLPHIDVVVPDDARELGSDLAAWRREERRRRRRARLDRFIAPFAKHGVVAPFLAGILVIALVSGAMLTFFGPRAPDPRPTMPLSVPTGRTGEIGGLLPDLEIVWQGRRHRSTELAGAVVLFVPVACGCRPLLAGIADKAAGKEIGFYLVADARGTELSVKAARTRLADDAERLTGVEPILIEDEDGRFADALRTVGLTYVLIDRNGGIFDYQPDLHQIDRQLSVVGATI
ncbi:hypothetical protein GCM10027589_09520 [Actinocorallia lasiicapitis]